MTPGVSTWEWPRWLAWFPLRIGLSGAVNLPAPGLRFYKHRGRLFLYCVNGTLWRVCVWWPRIGGVLLIRWPIPTASLSTKSP